MGCLYKYNGEWLTDEQIQNLQFEADVIPTLYDAELNNSMFEGISLPIKPSYENTIAFKKEIRRVLKKRLSIIQQDKQRQSGNIKEYKKLLDKEAEITLRIEGSIEEGVQGLDSEIQILESAPPINKLGYYIEKDMRILDSLLESEDTEDLQEARQMIAYYKKLGTFTVGVEHPLFETEQLFNANGELILDKSIVDKFKKLADDMLTKENKVSMKEQIAFENFINSNPKVKFLFGDKKLTYDELIKKGKGLQDASWIDMMVMDVTNGIMSDNGIIPQVAMNHFNNVYNKKFVKVIEIKNRIDALNTKVVDAISKLDNGEHVLSSLGILGVKGVSYDVFRAKTKDGLYRDNIVQRFTPEFAQELKDINKEYWDATTKASGIEIPKNATPEQKEKIQEQIGQMYQKAFEKKKESYRKNTIVLDVRKIDQIKQLFPEFSEFFVEDSSHEEGLKKVLGTEKGFTEEVQTQINLIKSYKVKLEVYKDSILGKYEVDTLENLPKKALYEIQSWEKKNSPFVFASHYWDQTELKTGKFDYTANMEFTHAIPRRNKLKIEGQGFVKEEQDSGFYDANFTKIENDPVLLEFHGLVTEVTTLMFETLPPEVREKFSATSIPALKKNIAEILSDKHIGLLEKLSALIREIYDNLRSAFGKSFEDSVSQVSIDKLTGIPNYKVSSSFFKTNGRQIEDRLNIEMLALRNNIELDIFEGRLDINTKIHVSRLNSDAINIIAENLGMTAPQFMSKYSGQEIYPKRLVKAGLTDQVVRENSFDLPKILKMYTALTMEYAARQEALPMITMLKDHYEQIRDNDGKSELNNERKNATRQFNSWFNRTVLGNYQSKNEFGDDRIKRSAKLGITGNQQIDSLTSKLQTTITGKIYRTDEKILIAKMAEALGVNQIEIPGEIQNRIEQSLEGGDEKGAKYYMKLQNTYKNIGKDFSASSAFDALFNFIRFKGLGWNLSSSVTNFAEGQIANFTVAASGDYFRPENIYKANDIVKSSILKNATFGKMSTPNARLVATLMDRYRVLQDASNQLQKATTKTTFSAISKLAPYEITKRTEYLNQAPLMVARLLDEKIIGIDGTESNVWDAMNPDGTLKENFATEENNANWVDANGTDFDSFSSLVNKMIVNTHGDYDQFRGNMAGETITGKALLSFKRWMARQFYQRFAKEQIDIESGLDDFKGRYRSHTQATAALHGAIIGFTGLSIIGSGGIGLLIGGAAGILGAKFYGAESNLSIIKELSIVGKELMMNMIRIPINSVTGKPTIKNIDLGPMKENMSSRDVKNLQAVLTDMSILLAWTALTLFAKGLFWDDDDEEDSPRRKAHNLAVNKLMQLSSQGAMYVNPIEAWKNTVGEIAIMRFFEDVQKTLVAVTGLLEGNDILQSGPNAGESKLLKQSTKTFFPGILKDPTTLGFGTQMERQFRKSSFDSWFHSGETNARGETRRIRAEYRKELEDRGLRDKELLKELNNKYSPKKKEESYEDLLERYE